MCRHSPDELPLTNPVVGKLKHDADNKRCAWELTTQLMGRVTDPAKREALRARAKEQMEDWDAAFGEYQAALRSVLVKRKEAADMDWIVIILILALASQNSQNRGTTLKDYREIEKYQGKQTRRWASDFLVVIVGLLVMIQNTSLGLGIIGFWYLYTKAREQRERNQENDEAEKQRHKAA